MPKVLRGLLFGFVALALLTVVLISSLSIYLSDQRVQNLIEQKIAEQTGGVIKIGRTDFSLARGLELSEIAFTPLDQPTPLLELTRLSVKYNIWKMFIGRLQVNAIKMLSPTITLREENGIWNFQSIIDYRSKHYPAAKEVKPVEPNSELVLSKLLPINPRQIFMPLSISLSSIGVDNLTASVERYSDKVIQERLSLRGPSLNVDAKWKHRQGTVVVDLGAHGDSPIVAEKTEFVGGDSANSLSATVAARVKLQLIDFFNIKLLAEVDSIVADKNGSPTPTISGEVKVDLALREDLSGVKISQADFNFGKILKSSLSGSVDFPNDNLDVIRLGLKEKLHLDFAAIGELAKPMMPGLAMSGAIRLDTLGVDGILDLKSLKEGKPLILPYITGAIHLENIEASDEAMGFLLLPANGVIGLSAGPNMSGNGSQIETTANINLMGLHVKQKTKKGEISVAIDNLFTGFTARALYPEISLPIFKLNVEAEHVIAGGAGLNSVDAPLYISINGDLQSKFQRASVTAAVELKDLFDASFMAECQDECSKIRSNAKVRVDELATLYSVALPILSKIGSNAVPRSLSGSIDFQAAARGKIPQPQSATLAQILESGDVKYDAELALSKFSAQIPLNNLDIENYEARMRLGGNLKQQKLTILQTLQKLGITLPAEKRAAPVRAITIERMNWDTEIKNEFSGPIQVSNPMGNSTAGLTNRLFIGKTTLDGILPRPINGLEWSTVAQMTELQRLTLQKFAFGLPDMGVSLSASGEVGLSKGLKPADFKAVVGLTVNPTSEDAVPGGVKMNGRVAFEAQAESKNMDLIDLAGKVEFDHFSVTVPGVEEKQPPRVTIENINGQVPFARNLSLKQLQEKDTTAPIVSVVNKNFAAVAEEYFSRNEDSVMKKANAMAIMDFGTVRPHFSDRRPLSIDRVEVANLELSKIEMDVEITQNWLALNQLVIGFLGGKIHGSTHLAFDTKPRALKTALHMTRLDTHKLVEKFPRLLRKASTGAFGGNPFIDAVLHMDYDFISNDMAGGLEIASIGKEQLKMILYFIDPEEENATIGDIRKALNFGEVRQVSVPIKNGQIGLDVDVRILAAPIPVPKLSRFPLAQVVKNMSAKSQDITDEVAEKEVPDVKQEK